MSKYKKLVNNSAIFAIGNFGSKFIGILMLPLYTHELTQAEYGQIELITVTLSLIIPLLTLTIVEAIVRFSLEKKPNRYNEVISNSLLIILCSFVLLLLLYPLLSQIEFINNFLGYFYILYIVQALQGAVKQFTRSINLTSVFMVSDLILTASLAIFNITFLVFWDLGIEGYLLSLILAYFINFLFLLVKSKAYLFVNMKYLNKKLIISMILYCLPLVPNNIMWWVINISDRYLIAYYLGLSSSGLYAIASKIPMLVSSMSSVFFNAWQISAIEESENDGKEEFYSKVFATFFFVMVTIASIYISFNKQVISIIVDSSYYEAWKYIPILIMAVVFSSFASFIGTNYVAMKKTKGAFYSSLVGGIVNVLLNLILIPQIGLYGASISTMIGFLVMWIYRIFDTKKYVVIEYPSIRIVFSIVLLFIQIIIGYLPLTFIISLLLNLIMLSVIILVGLKFISEPARIILNKLFLKRYFTK
ncbi:polysaccharide biosynthesis C-terminal domain-containing protein [Planococcus sp. SE5232]|uniref:oligosaccharide flippase family protein n=1 Tax=unclassified Planococcus (in: firmicutes) TaxID=2662419 RepID=UPI003D6A085E